MDNQPKEPQPLADPNTFNDFYIPYSIDSFVVLSGVTRDDVDCLIPALEAGLYDGVITLKPKTHGKTNKKGQKVGRKWFDGRPEAVIVRKLETVWALDGTDEEAALFADISKASLSEYLKSHPAIAERKEALKNCPVLSARQTVIKSLKSPEFAFRYLEKKKKDEFGTRLEMTGAGGGPIKTADASGDLAKYTEEELETMLKVIEKKPE